jgi:transposase InsO family protein
MDERTQFIAACLRHEVSMAELCRTFAISRKTGYKWLDRYVAEGPAGLVERSRTPHTHPQALEPDLVAVLLAARAAHPTWGPRRLLPWLAERQPDLALPAPSTVGDLLRRSGLTIPRTRRRHTPPQTVPLAHADAPNAVWCVDFKGSFRTGDGTWCTPLTITDACTRYLLRCQTMTTTDTAHVQPLFDTTFRAYGLPLAIRSDNGPPFASTGLAGLSRLSVWWLKLGIMPDRIAPGKPQQNGRHERFHRTLKQETAAPPQPTLRAQQRAFDRFQQEYNQERPHEALGQCPPARVYQGSPRVYRARVRPFAYPEADKVLRVKGSGEVYWRGAYIYLTAALAGEPVGLTHVGPGQWQVDFGPLVLGVLDERRGKIVPVPPPSRDKPSRGNPP